MKHNNCVNSLFPVSAYDDFHKIIPAFCKELPWFYEKEFRIVVQIINEDQRQMLQSENVKLAVVIHTDLYSDLNVYLGPESTLKSIDALPGIKKFVTSKIVKSIYTGMIHMNLKDRMCKACLTR